VEFSNSFFAGQESAANWGAQRCVAGSELRVAVTTIDPNKLFVASPS
jgi:hypothetical protein